MNTRIAARRSYGGTTHYFNAEDIDAFHAHNKLITFRDDGDEYRFECSLDELAEQLGPHYVRTHRAWLVRVDAVTSLERSEDGAVVVVGGLRVPVSRRQSPQVRRALMRDAITRCRPARAA